jgi:hypothetical protein
VPRFRAPLPLDLYIIIEGFRGVFLASLILLQNLPKIEE